MDTDKRQELIAAQTMAAQALDNGARLAARAAARPMTGRGRAGLAMDALGGALANPSEFWAGSCMVEGAGGVSGVEALALATKYAAARMAVGDFAFVRESLVGQAQWASVLAVKLAAQAAGEYKVDDQALLLKLAMSAQRQAAAALATAAALNKLVDCESVAMVGG
jgi:hypothetical protein